MAKVNFNAEHKKVLDGLLLRLPNVTAGTAIPGATPRSCGLVSPWAQERGRQVYLN